MKPHPRIRKTIKWGGAVVTALLVALFWATMTGPRSFGSGPRSPPSPQSIETTSFEWRRWSVDTRGGALVVRWIDLKRPFTPRFLPGAFPATAAGAENRSQMVQQRFAEEVGIREELRAIEVATSGLWPAPRWGSFERGRGWWILSIALESFRVGVGVALAVGALVTLAAWRLDTLARRRVRGGVNLCPKCTYDRAGIAADAKCPECGSGGGAR